ncbi:MAG: LysR family transcriptional regulator [Paracoccaceae bacterium]
MDLQLIKTFVEVASSGSFAAASERLFVTQSAVALRIQRLEEQLGRPLFLRSKHGTTLTAEGREFRGHAAVILRSWEQARQKVNALDAAPRMLTIGAQPSLWPRFGFGWLDRLREERPDLMLRAEMERAEPLAQKVMAGAVQVALTYQALARPELQTERLMEDHLVMVSPWVEATLADLAGRYVLIDWGPEFLRFHDEALPQLAEPRLVLGMGTLGAWFARNRPCAAYLPARYAQVFMDQGRMHLVKDAPSHSHQAWVVWRRDLDEDLRSVAEKTLNETVQKAEDAAAGVMGQLWPE